MISETLAIIGLILVFLVCLAIPLALLYAIVKIIKFFYYC
jgi:hypothetical protein